LVLLVSFFINAYYFWVGKSITCRHIYPYMRTCEPTYIYNTYLQEHIHILYVLTPSCKGHFYLIP
jgi:hypothetical protein